MATQTLPTITRGEVESHRSTSSCYVTVGDEVYDVTDFVEDHPGGGELIMEYAGKDITAILKDDASHAHSQAAYDILEDKLVGLLPSENANGSANGSANGKANGAVRRKVHPRTGMACEEDLSVDTDFDLDLRKHKFLDLSKPLFLQVWRSGWSKRFYLDQVHRPRHYKGGESAPFFGNFLEPFSKTAWWMIPLTWIPCVAYGTYVASQGLHPLALFLYFGFGFGLWSLIEYALHRFLFHLDYYLPDNRVGITMHFMLHGVHHYLPMDKYRLVMPPALFCFLCAPFWPLAHTILFWDWYAGTAGFCGGLFGYVCYDMTHYWIHFASPPLWYKELKRYHMAHHYLEYELAFGITSKFWDNVFGTGLPENPKME
ncbi:unnamed protein product [Clonostachys rosea]|uniref:Ceramide very long chain fatty acid hydroxylase n=1 Tax=Bionectria ochroleuca TaxID=29856 RepID=A0ABY6UPI7_BIOOC|nr:unnamed protein product [Clonostachys rosea]